MPRRPDAARTTRVAAIVATAVALFLVGPVQGAGEAAVRAAGRAWSAVFGDRPAADTGRRAIVVLAAPSLAERMSVEPGISPSKQRRWVTDVEAGQQLLLSALRERGIRIHREFAFTRTLNGFSAVLDARAVAELERTQGVTGIYPVRTVYPASAGTEALTQPDFRPGAGRRPEVNLPGFDGRGVTIALLDTGIDRSHPYLGHRVLRGWDVVDRDRNPVAEAKPGEPTRIEAHGTRMAGILVGSAGPAGLKGVAPAAKLFPIRVMGWQRTSTGVALIGRGDQLIAGLERAVDPDADGDVEDAAQVVAAPIVEPYAAFPDSPEARAVSGATTLGMLVVAPAGNDGRAGSAFGAVAGPGGTPDALAVGAIDSRRETLACNLRLRVGDDTVADESMRVLGTLGPRQGRALAVGPLVGPTLAHPSRATGTEASGDQLADFFDPSGVSLVAGRAALVPADGRPLATKARNAAEAGAAVLLVHGTELPAGALDLDESAGIPVIAVPGEAGRAAVEGFADAQPVTVELEAARTDGNRAYRAVAGFSSGGLAFDGRPRPDLVAPGVGLATADPGTNGDGSARYATVTGTSTAAALTAGAAALVAQARPDLAGADLRSLLIGNSARIELDGATAEPVTVQGAGALDLAAAVAGELAVSPASLAFGRADGRKWTSVRTLSLHNLSSRTLEIGFGFAPDQSGDTGIKFDARPARVSLRPGASTDITVTASTARRLTAGASGVFVVSADGARPVRVPWAVAVRPTDAQPLVDSVRLSSWQFQPSKSAPTVLAFRAGRVVSGPAGEAIEPVGLLDVELWTAGGKRLGVLARLRDLLPGRYAFGLTGRGPQGDVLAPGVYVVRLQAQRVDADDGTPPSTAEAVFEINS
jgi:subtilisin family serine protease